MSEQAFNPMTGTISATAGVPAGHYNGKFVKAELLPATDGDPMTGKGKRDYDSIRFVWSIATEGEYENKEVSVDTSRATGSKSGFYKVVCWLMGRNLNPGEPYDLMPCVGKQYLLTLGSKPGKQWIEVINAIIVPNQQ